LPNFNNQEIRRAGKKLYLNEQKCQYVLHAGKMQRCSSLAKAGFDAHFPILYTCPFLYFRLQKKVGCLVLRQIAERNSKSFLKETEKKRLLGNIKTVCNLEAPIPLTKEYISEGQS